MGNGITINVTGMDNLKSMLKSYSEKVKYKVGIAIYDAANKINEEAKKNLISNKSVITGSLIKSLRVDAVSPMQAKVGTEIVYATDVEFGTAAHEITPRTGKCLAFKIDGKMVFVKRVHHPGSKAKPFFNPAIETTRPILLNDLKAALHA